MDYQLIQVVTILQNSKTSVCASCCFVCVSLELWGNTVFIIASAWQGQWGLFTCCCWGKQGCLGLLQSCWQESEIEALSRPGWNQGTCLQSLVNSAVELLENLWAFMNWDFQENIFMFDAGFQRCRRHGLLHRAVSQTFWVLYVSKTFASLVTHGIPPCLWDADCTPTYADFLPNPCAVWRVSRPVCLGYNTSNSLFLVIHFLDAPLSILVSPSPQGASAYPPSHMWPGGMDDAVASHGSKVIRMVCADRRDPLTNRGNEGTRKSYPWRWYGKEHLPPCPNRLKMLEPNLNQTTASLFLCLIISLKQWSY